MRHALLIAVSVLLLAGCNEKCYKRADVTGQATCNSAPKNHDGTCPAGYFPACP